jgi:hypothetical protein
VSNVPYGFPLIPQRLKCYVIRATLLPGLVYSLRFDVTRQVPILAHLAGAEPDIEGVLVDEPLVFDRGCKWL